MAESGDAARRQVREIQPDPSPFDPVALEERLKVARAQRAAVLGGLPPASERLTPQGLRRTHTAAPNSPFDPDFAPPPVRATAPRRIEGAGASITELPLKASSSPVAEPQALRAEPPRPAPPAATRDASGQASRRPLGLGIAFAAGVGVSILAAVALRGPAPDAQPPVLAEAPAQAVSPAPTQSPTQVEPAAPQAAAIPTAIPTAPPRSPSVATPPHAETRAAASPAAAIPLRAPEPTAILTPPGTAQALRPAPRPYAPLPAETETEAVEQVLPRGLAEAPLARPETVAALPAVATRVTLHAPGLTPETEIAAVTQAAATAGFAASLPVPVNFVIASTHVRYYHAADLAAATALAAALPGGPAEPRDFTNAPNLAAPGTLEVWLAGSPRPAAMTRRAARPVAPEPALSPIAVTPLPAAPAAPPPPGPDAISVTPLPPARTAPPPGGVGRQVEGAIRNIERALGNTLGRVTGAP